MDIQVLLIIQVTLFGLILLLLIGGLQYFLHQVHFPKIFLGLYLIGSIYCLITRNISLFIIITVCFAFAYIGGIIGRYFKAVNKRIDEEFDKISKQK
ncbi:hypothetical protein KFD70_26515 [Bacillus pfraonensis]|uniref:hypothetical protein n=1 Tax=Bacillus TaxID=1386 RepID=UPI001571A234|nr:MULTISPECIES: hypothetical protein [Bacillus]MBC6972006.1 hypothetical protein [Bacillus sp. Xin]MBY0599167.1 hypothetical protein [Bacillus bingmayongensis]NSW39191.1 hypothetical protein [Bacillus sp. Xin1]HEK9104072.1 hypothetical protein [Bacillus pseudomycoides]